MSEESKPLFIDDFHVAILKRQMEYKGEGLHTPLSSLLRCARVSGQVLGSWNPPLFHQTFCVYATWPSQGSFMMMGMIIFLFGTKDMD